MGIKNIFSKLTDKALSSPAYQAKFQKAWETHAAAFGPIIEHAFEGDMEARTHLAAALNNLSRGEAEPARSRLEQLSKAVKTDEDKAAFLFFMGLLMEKKGAPQEAVRFYAGANQFGHSLYLSYLKTARHYHGEGGFSVAEKDYRRALECLDQFCGGAEPEMVKASIHANLAGCLTYKRDFAEAQAQLEQSAALVAEMPGRASIDAVLAAALGDEVRVRRDIAALEDTNGELAAQVRKQTDNILAGGDPHFACMPANVEKIPEFWDWFVRNETTIRNLLTNKDGKTPSQLMEQQMAPVFASPDQRLSFGLRTRKDGFTLLMCDNFSATRSHILQAFAETWPKQLEPKWEFRALHSPHEEELL